MNNKVDPTRVGIEQAGKLQSMTGYGRSQVQLESVIYLIEIKGVNSRFLDINFRGLALGAALEHQIRERLQRYFKRGKLDVFAGIGRGSAPTALADQGLFSRIIESGRNILKSHSLDSPSSMDTLTKVALERAFGTFIQQSNSGGSLGGVVAFDEGSAVFRGILRAVDSACFELSEMRSREGDKLRIQLKEYVTDLSALVDSIAQRSKSVAAELLDRSRQRVSVLLPRAMQADSEGRIDGEPNGRPQFVHGELDQARLYQELAIIADKSDISEELVRLVSHVKTISELINPVGPLDKVSTQHSERLENDRAFTSLKATIAKPNSIGKQIDFLLQETLRELNTLSVKCQNLEIVSRAVQGKLLVEQLKEQVQNLE